MTSASQSNSSRSGLNVLWADSELEEIRIDYGKVIITLTESAGRTVNITCCGYIGYEIAGFWDEVVIERAELSNGAEFLTRCIESLESRPDFSIESGDPDRNARSWHLLEVHFIDGARLRIVAARFELDRG